MSKNEKMVDFSVRIYVQACYDAIIKVPEGCSHEEAVEIAQSQLSDIPLGELSYVPDSDDIDAELCHFVKRREKNE